MRFLRFLVMAPVAALILVFAFANRDWVTIYFDPFDVSGLKPLPAPQYAVILAAIAVGVVAGGAATWIGQGRYRRAAREAEAEAARLRGQLQSARFATAPSLARPA